MTQKNRDFGIACSNLYRKHQYDTHVKWLTDLMSYEDESVRTAALVLLKALIDAKAAPKRHPLSHEAASVTKTSMPDVMSTAVAGSNNGAG